MKKLFLITILLLTVFMLASCGEKTETTDDTTKSSISVVQSHYPFQSVNEVRDAYGNILQQILYNTQTGDTYIYDYKYQWDYDAFYCTGSWLTIIEAKEEQSQSNVNVHKPTINVVQNGSSNNTQTPSDATGVVEETLLLNSGDVKVWLVGYAHSEFMDTHQFKLKVQNTGDRKVDIRTDNETVNGNVQMDDEIWLWESIDANKTTMMVINVYSSDLEFFEVSQLKSLTFDLIVSDNNNWDGILATKTTTITIN